MNTKRQTIWLVSMLSIMVVLSAYYLFTYDEDDLLNANADDMFSQPHVDLESEQVDINDYDINDDITYFDGSFSEADYDDLADILSQLETQQVSGVQSFDHLHRQRHEEMQEEMNHWIAVAASGSIDEQTSAQEKMYEMNDTWAKISHLEDVIRRDFPDAIIDQANNTWRVLVYTDEMDKSEAVTIMNMVMREMGASSDQVIVELSQ